MQNKKAIGEIPSTVWLRLLFTIARKFASILGAKWFSRNEYRFLLAKTMQNRARYFERMEDGPGSREQESANRSVFNKKLGLWGSLSESVSEREADLEERSCRKGKLILRRSSGKV